MSSQRQSPAPTSSVPAVTRALRILQLMGSDAEGATAGELLRETGMPRATLYRLLAVLCESGFAQSTGDSAGRYRIGPEFTRLAGAVGRPRDLMEAARPIMDRLAQRVRETVKLVVVDGTQAHTSAVADTGLEARVTALVGTRVPLHIGASQRLLLAHSPVSLWRRVLAQSLEPRTSRTFTDPGQLRASLEHLRRVDSEQTHGEGIQGVGAAAALVRDAQGQTQAALVAVYIHAGKSARELQAIRSAVEAAARELSRWDAGGSD